MSSTASAERQQTQPSNFRFDTSKIEWKDFLTEGCYYRILDVNIEAHTADMLVKFEPERAVFFIATWPRPRPWCSKVRCTFSIRPPRAWSRR